MLHYRRASEPFFPVCKETELHLKSILKQLRNWVGKRYCQFTETDEQIYFWLLTWGYPKTDFKNISLAVYDFI